MKNTTTLTRCSITSASVRLPFHLSLSLIKKTTMAKIDSLRRILLPCFYPTATATATTTTATITTKKRLSTSLIDDIQDDQYDNNPRESSNTTPEESFKNDRVPARPSKSMVIGTLFGHKRNHVRFCIQQDRLNTKPSLLLELSMPTSLFIKEMQTGLVRIALECNRSDLSSCPLHSIPVWTLYCNGRKVGFAERRKATDKDRMILKKMESSTVGAGVIPALTEGDEEVMYMRASYEHVVGSSDSESFHLINPDGCLSQELSFFLLRTR